MFTNRTGDQHASPYRVALERGLPVPFRSRPGSSWQVVDVEKKLVAQMRVGDRQKTPAERLSALQQSGRYSQSVIEVTPWAVEVLQTQDVATAADVQKKPVDLGKFVFGAGYYLDARYEEYSLRGIVVNMDDVLPWPEGGSFVKRSFREVLLAASILGCQLPTHEMLSVIDRRQGGLIADKFMEIKPLGALAATNFWVMDMKGVSPADAFARSSWFYEPTQWQTGTLQRDNVSMYSHFMSNAPGYGGYVPLGTVSVSLNAANIRMEGIDPKNWRVEDNWNFTNEVTGVYLGTQLPEITAVPPQNLQEYVITKETALFLVEYGQPRQTDTSSFLCGSF